MNESLSVFHWNSVRRWFFKNEPKNEADGCNLRERAQARGILLQATAEPWRVVQAVPMLAHAATLEAVLEEIAANFGG